VKEAGRHMWNNVKVDMKAVVLFVNRRTDPQARHETRANLRWTWALDAFVRIDSARITAARRKALYKLLITTVTVTVRSLDLTGALSHKCKKAVPVKIFPSLSCSSRHLARRSCTEVDETYPNGSYLRCS